MTDWMQTYTGVAFRPLAPQVADIKPQDIAHALGMLCRYGGHVKRFYSVAEHCVLMSHAVAPEHAAAALLHDATEAYAGDMIRPLKQQMPAYMDAEKALGLAIAERFRIDPYHPSEVTIADSRILLDERAALLGPTPQPWHPAIEALEPLGVSIHAWDPQRAGYQYYWRMGELGLLG